MRGREGGGSNGSSSSSFSPQVAVVTCDVPKVGEEKRRVGLGERGEREFRRLVPRAASFVPNEDEDDDEEEDFFG